MLIPTLWVAAFIALLLLALAHLLPQQLENAAPAYLFLASISFHVQNFLPYLAVASLIATAMAGIFRQGRLLAVCAVALAASAGTALWALRPARVAPVNELRLRVMSMNVRWDNARTDLILAEVRRADPDVLVVEEYSRQQAAALTALSSQFPFHVGVANDHGGWAVFSGVPFTTPPEDRVVLAGEARGARVTVRVGDSDVAIYGLHLTCPAGTAAIGRNRAEFAALARRIAGEAIPVVIAGDFNCTEMTSNMAALRSVGMTSAHRLAGRGLGFTWPDGAGLIPAPAFRIDHILVSGRLTCARSEVLGSTGSDHRPIVADVAWAAAN